jgi:hypothetical protein
MVDVANLGAPMLQGVVMQVAEWLQRQRAATIDYQKAEKHMLHARLGRPRVIIGAQILHRRLSRSATNQEDAA